MSIDETFQVTDLCQAATNDDIEKIRSILDRQPNLVNVHVTESNEHQAIHYAVINQNKNAVRLLMKRGANHTSGIYPHRSATSALTMAEDRGQSDIVQVIRDEDEKRQLASCQ
ncbi:TPA: ankyrin repeat domain-containing protein, partial [Candidatus Poribacteria bacterium]|nr:ankyrin repeat domain-containing protein [Candidatus Poribacteria bacterium]